MALMRENGEKQRNAYNQQEKHTLQMTRVSNGLEIMHLSILCPTTGNGGVFDLILTLKVAPYDSYHYTCTEVCYK